MTTIELTVRLELKDALRANYWSVFRRWAMKSLVIVSGAMSLLAISGVLLLRDSFATAKQMLMTVLYLARHLACLAFLDLRSDQEIILDK
jgi:hypothetical protein